MRLQRPSHATVIAYLALFIALSGTAIAAKKIGSDGLRKAAVTSKKIADAAVTTPKLANDAVTGGKLDNGSVGENKLAADAVTAGKLAQNSVGTNKIRDEAVESGKIANGAVTEGKIANGAVTEGKIANDAVIGTKVAAGSLDLTDYARAVVDISPTPTAPLTSGTCQQISVAAPGVQAGDLPLVLQPVPTPDARIQAVSASSAVANQLDVLLCNYSPTSVAAPPAVPLRIALLR